MVILKPNTRFGHHTSHHRVIYKHVKYIEQIESWDWFGTLLLLGLFYEPPDGALIGETKLPHSCTWWRRLTCPAKGPKCTSDKDCPGQSKCCLHTCGAYCTARVPSHQGNELQHDFFNFNDIQKKVGFGNLRFLQEILAVTSLSNSMQTMFVAIFSGHKKRLKCGMWNAGLSRLWHHFSLNTFGGVLCHPALFLERGKKNILIKFIKLLYLIFHKRVLKKKTWSKIKRSPIQQHLFVPKKLQYYLVSSSVFWKK